MKTKQISVEIYEVGDVIDITNLVIRSSHKSKVYKDKGDRAVIFAVYPLQTGGFSYDVITSGGAKMRIKEEESYGAKYIGRVNLDILFEDSGNCPAVTDKRVAALTDYQEGEK